MDSKTGTYIVLLNWNGWRDTIACLESLLPDIAAGARVIVCDNASSDGSLDHIEAWVAGAQQAARAEHPRLRRLQDYDLAKPEVQRISRAAAVTGEAEADAALILIENGANLGFAAGNNVGLRFALRQADMTHAWLLNNDTLVERDCLTQMHRRLALQSGPAVCGSVIHFFDEPEHIQCIGGNRFDYRRGLASESVGRYAREADAPTIRQVEGSLDYLSGCSMLLPRSFLETVGLMSEDYFLYYEEIDWFTRAAGRFDLIVAGGARLYHREGGSIGSRTWRRAPSPLSDLHMFRSRLLYMAKYHPQSMHSCVMNNWLDVAKRLARGQFRNALVVARVNLAATPDPAVP